MVKMRNRGLNRVKAKFDAWRKARVRGERIPERLWNAAVKVAGELGVCQTAKSLKLDYYALQRRLYQQSESPAAPAFIELTPPPTASTSECVIELEDATGASLRMHLKGVDASNIASLGHSLWKAK